jgi:hypothetical protein
MTVGNAAATRLPGIQIGSREAARINDLIILSDLGE